jgi:GNAT superfamily N-acetyltransferase
MAFRHPMQGLEMRPAASADLSWIESTIGTGSISEDVSEFLVDRYGTLSHLLDLCNSHLAQCLIGHRGGRTAGCIAWRQDEFVGALLVHIVSPEFQDLGIGTALLAGFVDGARESGLRVLETRIPESLERAGRLYTRQGFRRTVQWIRLGRGDAVVQVRSNDLKRIKSFEVEGFTALNVWCHYERILSGRA